MALIHSLSAGALLRVGQTAYRSPRVQHSPQRQATLDDIHDRMSNGTIEVPAGFLKTCGEPLCRVIARFAQTSLGAEYFPRRFRDARVVVLRELGKTATQLQRWLPIALLNIGKI